jgi:tetratricopeptide (TPR) repeat protein
MSRYKLLAIGCWLLAGCFGLLPDSSALFVSAQQEAGVGRETAAALYNDGAFTEAAEQWAAVAAQEPNAVDARINAAQAYLQADDLGRAMLWFRRAQALDPRHSAVQLGLALVRALRIDILGDEPGVLPAVERLSAEIVSRTELAWLTVLAWSAAFGVGTAAYLRRKWKFAAIIVSITALTLLVLLIGREISVRSASPVVVTAFETTLSSEPGPDGVALSRIYAGAEARIADRREGWILITLADGRAGWLPESDVEPLAE